MLPELPNASDCRGRSHTSFAFPSSLIEVDFPHFSFFFVFFFQLHLFFLTRSVASKLVEGARLFQSSAVAEERVKGAELWEEAVELEHAAKILVSEQRYLQASQLLGRKGDWIGAVETLLSADMPRGSY